MKQRRFQNLQWQFLSSFLLNSLVTLLLSLLLIVISLIAIQITTGDVITFLLQWELQQFGLSFLILFVIAGGIAALFSGTFFAFYTGRRIKSKLQQVKEGAVFWSRGHLSYRVTVQGSDEISEIGDQWNQMAERFENQVYSLQKLIQQNKEFTEQAEKVAVIEERQRLARDLHDSISQQLFAISMTASATEKVAKMKPEQTAMVEQQLHDLKEMAAHAQAEMRALLLHLRPVQLENDSLKDGLEKLLAELQTKHPIQYDWELEAPAVTAKGIDEQLFRIVQEALSNTLRHSEAEKVTVRLKNLSETLLLLIEDDGIGFSEQDQKKASYGLSTMKERAEELGGTLDIVSVKGKGTRLEVRIPIAENG